MADALGVEIALYLKVGVAADVAELELRRVNRLERRATVVTKAVGAGSQVLKRLLHAVESLELGFEQSVQVSVVDGGRASSRSGELDDIGHEPTSGDCPNYRRKRSGTLGLVTAFFLQREPRHHLPPIGPELSRSDEELD